MTGTQKALALLAAIVVVGLLYGLTANKGEDPKKPTTASAEPTTASNGSATPLAHPTGAPTPQPSNTVIVPPIVSGAPVDMATLATEAKSISTARDLLNAGKPREAIAEIEGFEKIRTYGPLAPEATMLKIEAYPKVNRRTDAVALSIEARTDPKMEPYRSRIQELLSDAGLIAPPPPPINNTP